MKVVLCTPKAADRIFKSLELNQLLKEKFTEFRIEPTVDVYINMLGGWSEEECDNTAYIVDEDHFKDCRLKLEIPNDFPSASKEDSK